MLGCKLTLWTHQMGVIADTLLTVIIPQSAPTKELRIAPAPRNTSHTAPNPGNSLETASGDPSASKIRFPEPGRPEAGSLGIGGFGGGGFGAGDSVVGDCESHSKSPPA